MTRPTTKYCPIVHRRMVQDLHKIHRCWSLPPYPIPIPAVKPNEIQSNEAGSEKKELFVDPEMIPEDLKPQHYSAKIMQLLAQLCCNVTEHEKAIELLREERDRRIAGSRSNAEIGLQTKDIKNVLENVKLVKDTKAKILKRVAAEMNLDQPLPSLVDIKRAEKKVRMRSSKEDQIAVDIQQGGIVVTLDEEDQSPYIPLHLSQAYSVLQAPSSIANVPTLHKSQNLIQYQSPVRPIPPLSIIPNISPPAELSSYASLTAMTPPLLCGFSLQSKISDSARTSQSPTTLPTRIPPRDLDSASVTFTAASTPISRQGSRDRATLSRIPTWQQAEITSPVAIPYLASVLPFPASPCLPPDPKPAFLGIIREDGRTQLEAASVRPANTAVGATTSVYSVAFEVQGAETHNLGVKSCASPTATIPASLALQNPALVSPSAQCAVVTAELLLDPEVCLKKPSSILTLKPEPANTNSPTSQTPLTNPTTSGVTTHTETGINTTLYDQSDVAIAQAPKQIHSPTSPDYDKIERRAWEGVEKVVERIEQDLGILRGSNASALEIVGGNTREYPDWDRFKHQGDGRKSWLAWT